MNYRHSFHAGNFADLVKHALLLWLIAAKQSAGPLTVIETHAGAGLYDLRGEARRSGEAEAGVARLMDGKALPPLMRALADQVAAVNPPGRIDVYPGSPVLTARMLRSGDKYIGFESQPSVAGLLREALEACPAADGRDGDGYVDGLAEAIRTPGPLVLIDPPFERPDDYLRAADTAASIGARDPAATVAVWTPIKDMETFDAFLRRLHAQGARDVLVAEARLRPLSNPMKMNGCAMVVLGAPAGAEMAARDICGWVVRRLGDAGGRAEVWID